jgi:putative tricarboxylic transport membrane protein
MPLTFGMDGNNAMMLMGGIMGAVSAGGAITSILINTPGGAPNAATCFDGYPMAQQGRAGAAIGAAAVASTVGGLIGVVVLIAVIPLLREIVLLFGPPEFFMLSMMGLAAVALSTGGQFLRGLIAGAIGLLLSFVGFDSISGQVRFTLGSSYLWDGIPLVPALTGLFAVTEMIALSIAGGTVAKDAAQARIAGIGEGVRAVFKHWKVTLQGSAIGTFIGAVPGLGGTVAAFLSYTAAMQISKQPETFGRGNIEGVIGPEAANNSKDGGSLIPTLAFGIPGSAEMAVFLGVLVLIGVEPGPMLLIKHQGLIFALVVALSASCILATIVTLLVTRPLAMVTLIDVHILAPAVIAVSLVGVYALDNRLGDVVVAVVFGVLGYVMMKFRFPRITLVIALVLGELAEKGYHQSLNMAGGDWTIFFTRWLSLALFVVTAACLLWPACQSLRRRRAL